MLYKKQYSETLTLSPKAGEMEYKNNFYNLVTARAKREFI